MEALELAEVFRFFVHGMVIGGLISAVPFIIGYCLSVFIEFLKGKS